MNDDVHDAQYLYDIWENAVFMPPHKQQKSEQPPQELFFPKCLVLLSYQPYWDLFRKFLCLIYCIALTPAPLPLECFIAHFVAQVPIPPPNVQIQLCYTTAAPWTIEHSGRWALRDFSFQPLFSCLRIWLCGCVCCKNRKWSCVPNKKAVVC